jgi:Uncharacterized protein conserved in bacteria
MFANLPAIAFAQSPCPPRIHVEILDIRNSKGSVACVLFESSDGFPAKYLRCATNIMMTKVLNKHVSFDFLDIAPGTYALAVIHDENVNGKLDTNWLGAPKEGYGFSNDVKGVFGAPAFSAASFLYDRRNIDLTISLNY